MNFTRIKKQDIIKYQVGLYVGILLLFFLCIYLPVQRHTSYLKEKIKINNNYLKKILELEHTYRSFLKQSRFNVKNNRETNLVSLIEKILKNLNIQDNLISIVPSYRNTEENKYKEQILDIKLEGLGLKETVRFLENIKKYPKVNIVRLNIIRKQQELNTLFVHIVLKTKVTS